MKACECCGCEEPHLYSLAQAALADAAQAAELVAVGGHQQVLRHGDIQIGTLQLLKYTRKLLSDRHRSLGK